MYQSIYYEREQNMIHLWDDTAGYSKFPYQRYGYILDQNGDYKTLDDKIASKIFNWHEQDEDNGLIYESDVNPEMRTLIDKYYETDDSSIDHRQFILDIEVDSTKGFPLPSVAENEITAISYYYAPMKFYCAFILDREGRIKGEKTKNRAIIPCISERDLLLKFYDHYEKLSPTIISGWNSDWFDIPYIYNRSVKVVGKAIANRLSPIGIVKWNKNNNTYKIAGVSQLDLLLLYKKFTQNEQPMYSLDFISKLELKRGKIKYDGTLDDLLKNDPEKFLEYNLNDVELVVALDAKKALIDLAIGVAHKGHIPYEDVYMSSRFIDGASLVYCKRNGLIAPNRAKREKNRLERDHKIGETHIYCMNTIDERTPLTGQLKFSKSKSVHYTYDYIDYADNYFVLAEPLDQKILSKYDLGFHFEGAFVKEPIPGKYIWIYDLDLASMYPSNIMTNNISPETKIGKILQFKRDYFFKNPEHIFRVYIGGDVYQMTSKEIKEYIVENNYSLASNGVMYDMSKIGLIPSILNLWFGERTQFKDLRDESEHGTDEYKFYDARQNVLKVMLNSFYGVLGLSSFRFYDLDNADAVTHTGRDLIMFSAQMANYFYNSEIGSDNTDYVIYTDTDSIFVSAVPLVKHRYPEADITDNEVMSKYILEIAKEVQTFINEAYTPYAKKYHFVDKHRWKIKQELIARSGLWIAKKRYAQWIINKEGKPADYLDVKGIDVVRSNFPTEFREFTKGVLTDILKDVPRQDIDKKVFALKDRLPSLDALNIMFPVGVKDVDDYRSGIKFKFNKGTPAHVKAALAYNDLLDHLEYKTVEPIKEGDKIKWTYLRQNPYNLESIALKGDNDPPELEEFASKYMDRYENFDRVLKGKLNDFYSALGWGKLSDSDQIDEFFSF